MATKVDGAEQREMQKSFQSVSDNFGGSLEDPLPFYRQKMADGPVMKGDILEELGVPPIFGNARGTSGPTYSLRTTGSISDSRHSFSTDGMKQGWSSERIRR